MIEKLKAELIQFEKHRPWREPTNDLGRNYNLGYQHAIQRVMRCVNELETCAVASAATAESTKRKESD